MDLYDSDLETSSSEEDSGPPQLLEVVGYKSVVHVVEKSAGFTAGLFLAGAYVSRDRPFSHIVAWALCGILVAHQISVLSGPAVRDSALGSLVTTAARILGYALGGTLVYLFAATLGGDDVSLETVLVAVLVVVCVLWSLKHGR
jgi:hypothetical protein